VGGPPHPSVFNLTYMSRWFVMGRDTRLALTVRTCALGHRTPFVRRNPGSPGLHSVDTDGVEIDGAAHLGS
jgi:hypothetical protein